MFSSPLPGPWSQPWLWPPALNLHSPAAGVNLLWPVLALNSYLPVPRFTVKVCYNYSLYLNSVCTHMLLLFKYNKYSSKEFLDIQTTIECRCTLKRVHHMIITCNGQLYLLIYFLLKLPFASFLSAISATKGLDGKNKNSNIISKVLYLLFPIPISQGW